MNPVESEYMPLKTLKRKMGVPLTASRRWARRGLLPAHRSDTDGEWMITTEGLANRVLALAQDEAVTTPDERDAIVASAGAAFMGLTEALQTTGVIPASSLMDRAKRRGLRVIK
jgi:hypothetical protein